MVEQITRIGERPHVPRDVRGDVRVKVLPTTAVAEPATEFTDTLVFKLPTLQLDPITRERERILPPGASGQHGGAYKMLRTQVLKRLDQLGANTIGVLSSTGSEGKTLTAINLAIAIAAGSMRTALLVDFDLRNPSIHRRFGYSPEVGVEDCLLERRSIHEAMVKVEGYDRLTILPARGKVEQSSELLSSDRAAELANEIRTRYANRIVIFDLPPVLMADDALAFTRHLQAGLLVIGEGKARGNDVLRTIDLLRDLPIVGTVLNGSRDAAETYY
jgi:protein-tyrosine kinase